MRSSTQSLFYATLFVCCGILFFLLSTNVIAQNNFIYTKEGRMIMNKKQLISTCLEALHKNKTDSTAVAICECQVSKIDRHFSNQQYKRFNHAGIINVAGLLDEDSLIYKQI